MPATKKATKKAAAAPKPKKTTTPAKPAIDLRLSTDLESLRAQAQSLSEGSKRRQAARAYDGLADAFGAVLALIKE